MSLCVMFGEFHFSDESQKFQKHLQTTFNLFLFARANKKTQFAMTDPIVEMTPSKCQ